MSNKTDKFMKSLDASSAEPNAKFLRSLKKGTLAVSAGTISATAAAKSVKKTQSTSTSTFSALSALAVIVVAGAVFALNQPTKSPIQPVNTVPDISTGEVQGATTDKVVVPKSEPEVVQPDSEEKPSFVKQPTTSEVNELVPNPAPVPEQPIDDNDDNPPPKTNNGRDEIMNPNR
jgi:hypothetical protein